MRNYRLVSILVVTWIALTAAVPGNDNYGKSPKGGHSGRKHGGRPSGGGSIPDKCKCPKWFEPVCGSDGQTYPNVCVLTCLQENDPCLELDYNGSCEPDSCICTLEYNPVCGNDGLTYSNLCALNCAARSNPGLVPCPTDGTALCGSDGVTYANACLLNCSTTSNSSIVPCGTVGPAICATDGHSYDNVCALNCATASNPSIVACSNNGPEVCGSNGVTYTNECLLICSASVHNKLQKKYNGRCYNKGGCACTREYKPVCGSDGKTYSNYCLLKCAARKRKYLTVGSKGPCAPPDNSCTKKCYKDREDAVCGNDGNTYRNICEFNCACTKEKSLKLAGTGSCEIPYMSDEDECVCEDKDQPVCGSDEVTYANQCRFECATKYDKDLVKKHDGTC